MRAIRNAGLNAVYLWACWGWVEPEPGTFLFDDYDDLVECAAAENLQVIFNTVAEIQPFWIHREIPDSVMVDHRGGAVASSLRVECNVGLTPGGCTDNPVVRDRMRRFLRELGMRYANATNVVAWDLWNETRWARQAGGYVCFCEHTLGSFRAWLEHRHAGLEQLNRAWRRRYSSWDDVFPASVPGRPYTDQIEFMRFLSSRAAAHMAFRRDALRAVVPEHHLVVAHGANSACLNVPIDEHEQALSRGVDSDFMSVLDGFGASIFPVWFNLTSVDFASRAEASRSAVGNKIFWVGELQGGSARGAMEVRDPVPGALQQRWLWNLIGRGAKAVNFWCWRDEVFARESSGFGIVGHDGHAPGRIAALAQASNLIGLLGKALDDYQPDPALVGVVFDRSVYYLDWAQHGNTALHATASMHSYLKALEQAQLSYDVVEPHHQDRLSKYRVIFMPFPLIVDPALASAVISWVRDGGTLVVESELDSYDEFGFYRPPEERPFAAALGIESLGRRTIVPPKSRPDWIPSFLETTQPEVDPQGFKAEHGSWHGTLRTALWYEALNSEGAEILGVNRDGPLLVHRRVGNGHVYAIGAFLGLAHARVRNPDFETFVAHVVEGARGEPLLRCSVRDGETLQWRSGRAGNDRLLFVVNYGEEQQVTFTGPSDMLPARERPALAMTDGLLLSAHEGAGAPRLDATIPAGAYAVLSWPDGVAD